MYISRDRFYTSVQGILQTSKADIHNMNHRLWVCIIVITEMSAWFCEHSKSECDERHRECDSSFCDCLDNNTTLVVLILTEAALTVYTRNSDDDVGVFHLSDLQC